MSMSKKKKKEKLGPLQKLDEAIQALEAAGYVFMKHTVEDRTFWGTDTDYARRTITLKCFKSIRGAPYSEAAEIMKLKGFSSPVKHFRKLGRHLIPLDR